MKGRWIWSALLVAGGAALAYLSSPSRRPLQRGTARLLYETETTQAWNLELTRGGQVVARMVSVHIEPGGARARIVSNPDREPLSALAPQADVVANAGFFTPEFEPTGLLVSEGRILHAFVGHGGSAGSGVLVWRNDGTITLHDRGEFALDRVEDIRVAIQAGPRLVEADAAPGIRSNDYAFAHRTVVGRDRAGRFVILAVHSTPRGQFGPSLWEMMRLVGEEGLGMVSPDLALDVALNLDGGPSSGLFVRPAEIEMPEGEAVPSALVLELTE